MAFLRALLIHHLSCHTCILHHSCSQLAYHSRCSGRDGAETAGPSSRPPEWRSQNGNQVRVIWTQDQHLSLSQGNISHGERSGFGGGVSAPCPCLAVPGSPEVTDLPIVIRWQYSGHRTQAALGGLYSHVGTDLGGNGSSSAHRF